MKVADGTCISAAPPRRAYVGGDRTQLAHMAGWYHGERIEQRGERLLFSPAAPAASSSRRHEI